MGDPGRSGTTKQPWPRCPACGDPLPEPQDASAPPTGRWPCWPFCSPRCRQIDLGRWLDGTYRIAGPPAIREPDAEDAEP